MLFTTNKMMSEGLGEVGEKPMFYLLALPKHQNTIQERILNKYGEIVVCDAI